MHKLSKNELDELFRDGADQQEFPYNEAAWASMESKLDADDRKRRGLLWFAGFIGVSLIAASVWYYAQSQTTTKVSTNTPQVNIAQSSTADNSQIKEEDLSTIVQSNQSLESIPSQANLAIHSSLPRITNTGANSELSNNTSSNIANQKINTNSATNRITNNIIGTSIPNTNNVSVSSNVANTPSGINTITTNSIKQVTKSNTNLLQISPIATYYNNRLAYTSSLVLNKPALIEVYKSDEDVKSSWVNKLSFAAHVSPEWSSVGLDMRSRGGWKVGGKIGVKISNRFEISTGLAYSRKFYGGKGTDYKLTEGSQWLDDIVPTAMEAKGDILEIPLDITYHHNGVGNTGFVLEAGLRSFMLHSEWYGFEYDPSQYRPDLVQETTMRDENKHLVGALQLSAGYQRRLKNNFAIQISPYLQIPITGIGAGKVNLYSAGLQFAARFDSK